MQRHDRRIAHRGGGRRGHHRPRRAVAGAQRRLRREAGPGERRCRHRHRPRRATQLRAAPAQHPLRRRVVPHPAAPYAGAGGGRDGAPPPSVEWLDIGQGARPMCPDTLHGIMADIRKDDWPALRVLELPSAWPRRGAAPPLIGWLMATVVHKAGREGAVTVRRSPTAPAAAPVPSVMPCMESGPSRLLLPALQRDWSGGATTFPSAAARLPSYCLPHAAGRWQYRHASSFPPRTYGGATWSQCATSCSAVQ